MTKWLKLWPFLTTAIVIYFNVELILIPKFMILGMRGWELFGYSEVAAALELAYYGWFFWWLGALVKNNPKFKDFYDDAKARGIDKILKKLVKILVELLVKESKNERLNSTKNGNPKRESFFTLFLLGIGIGTWLLGLLVFHATKSYTGLVGLFLGNAVKVACFVLLANFVGLWFYILVTIVALFKAYRFLSNQIKNKLNNIAMSL